MKITNKINDSKFEIIMDAPVMEPIIQIYNIDELKARELSITQSINDFVKEKKKELAEIQNLISIAQNLGLKTANVLQDEKLLAEKAILDLYNSTEKVEVKPVEEVPLDEKTPIEEVLPVGP